MRYSFEVKSMKSFLSVKPIYGKIFELNEPILEYLVRTLEDQNMGAIDLEGRVLAITSKIVSLSEGRVIDKKDIDKTALIKKESDVFLGEIGYGCYLTVKHGLLLPTAGIDESNAQNEWYILFPQDPFFSASQICHAIKLHFKLKKFGVLLTDSRSSPLRVGVIGVALSYAGFKGVKSRIGQKDLFGRKLKMTQIAVADALAVSAVLTMGESDECTPLALIESSDLEFVERVDSDECKVSLEADIYSPLFKKFMSRE
jgi:F420-0:gamma-glutamyl ligase